jgi:hypothetical protein
MTFRPKFVGVTGGDVRRANCHSPGMHRLTEIHIKGGHAIHWFSTHVVFIRGVRACGAVGGLFCDEQAGGSPRQHPRGGHLVPRLGGRVICLYGLAVVVPGRHGHRRGRSLAGQCQVAGVPDRLPDREGAGGRQHLRVPDGVHLLCGAGGVSEAGADDRHPGRAGAARGHDPGGCLADRAVPLDPVCVRRVPAVHRHQDVVGRRPGARPGQQPRAQMDPQPLQDLRPTTTARTSSPW